MLSPFVIFAVVCSAITVLLCGFSGISALLFAVLFFTAYFIVGLLLLCLVLWIMAQPVDINVPQEQDDPKYRKMTVFTLSIGLKLLNVKVHTEGVEQIPDGRFLLIQNHRTMFDPLISLCALDKYKLGFITKPENMNIPIIGKFAHRICSLPIDRESPRNAVKAINAATDYLKRDICSVGLYPEGTRNRNNSTLLPFHNASLKIAVKAGCPIVVTSLSGAESIRGNAPFKRTNINLKVCGIIPAEKVKASSTAELSAVCRKLLCEGLGIPFEEEKESD